MFRVSRRSLATVGAIATILLGSAGTVAGADPDSLTSAHANGSSTGTAVMLGAMSHRVPGDTGPVRLQQHGKSQHGGGLDAPATDTAPEPLDGRAPASGVGGSQGAWVVVFVVGLLGSLRYMARRSRL